MSKLAGLQKMTTRELKRAGEGHEIDATLIRAKVEEVTRDLEAAIDLLHTHQDRVRIEKAISQG